eukprot:3764145-Pleurochrysis_carterae.AAC.1
MSNVKHKQVRYVVQLDHHGQKSAVQPKLPLEFSNSAFCIQANFCCHSHLSTVHFVVVATLNSL